MVKTGLDQMFQNARAYNMEGSEIVADVGRMELQAHSWINPPQPQPQPQSQSQPQPQPQPQFVLKRPATQQERYDSGAPRLVLKRPGPLPGHGS